MFPPFRSSSALNLALSEAACHAYAHIPPHALPPCPPAAHGRQDLILAHRQVVAVVVVVILDPLNPLIEETGRVESEKVEVAYSRMWKRCSSFITPYRRNRRGLSLEMIDALSFKVTY